MKKLAIVAMVLAACARPSSVGVAPEWEPLEISILPPSSGYGFWVNQPAYVALFDVVAGQGVSLIYPRAGFQVTQMVDAGVSFAHGPVSFRQRDYFIGRQLGQPHLLLAVASRKPLNVSASAGYSSWLTYKLGVASFVGSSFDVMNQLFDEVIPAQPDDDWATAMYLVYPNLPWRENVYQLIRCADGQIYVVNVETPVFVCPAPRAPVTAPVDARPRRPETTAVSAAIARVGRGGLPVLQVSTEAVHRPSTAADLRSGRTLDPRSPASVRQGYQDYGRRVVPENQSQAPRPVAESPATRTSGRQLESQPASQPQAEPARRETPSREQ